MSRDVYAVFNDIEIWGHVSTRTLPLALSRDGRFYENGSTQCSIQSEGTKVIVIVLALMRMIM